MLVPRYWLKKVEAESYLCPGTPVAEGQGAGFFFELRPVLAACAWEGGRMDRRALTGAQHGYSQRTSRSGSVKVVRLLELSRQRLRTAFPVSTVSSPSGAQ